MAFKKGTSGNPAGRKPGTTAGAKIRAAIEQHSEAILTTVIRAATNGDMQAARMLLDRITPPLKAVQQPIAVKLSGNTLTERARSILDAVTRGDMTADDAKDLIGALAAIAKISEVDDLMKRVQALEARFNEPS